eukprot:4202068-Amphidinium_carterae.1
MVANVCQAKGFHLHASLLAPHRLPFNKTLALLSESTAALSKVLPSHIPQNTYTDPIQSY